MRILITTGLSEGDTGGPSQYGPRLRDEFQALGHKVKVVSYGFVEKALPVGLRHIYFFLKIIPAVFWADKVMALDTFSVGVPSLFAARLFGRKIIVRIGGDFLWESYVERTGEKITLRQFNSAILRLNIKEKLILYFTKILLKSADKLSFNTEWQKNIWHKQYNISYVKSCVVRNYIPPKSLGPVDIRDKKFLWAGRKIKLKNLNLLQEVGNEVQREVADFKLEIVSGISHLKLQDIIRNCYAVVLPSFSEVCPNFILETVSHGKPFIMTEETGLKEVYNKGGIFIDPFDKKALKEAILSMSDTGKYKQYQKELTFFEPRPWRTVAREFLSICQ